MQVFGIVNELLAKNSETRDRSLSVRTYQVTPLSQKSGLIQWCNNTQVSKGDDHRERKMRDRKNIAKKHKNRCFCVAS